MTVYADTIVADVGTIVIFEGVAATGERVRFAADHRPAGAIIEAIFAGELPVCDVPEWAVL